MTQNTPPSAPQKKKRPYVHQEKEYDTASKKPYEKPAFSHEKVFETMALACGKVQKGRGNCNKNKRNS
jgi:hypothetical protein